MRQWWELKSQLFDTVLFFKVMQEITSLTLIQKRKRKKEKKRKFKK